MSKYHEDNAHLFPAGVCDPAPTILNLTQHAASAAQLAEGVYDAPPEIQEEIRSLLNFETLPTTEVVKERAWRLAAIADRLRAPSVMIGGAPYLIGPLSLRLRYAGRIPLFAFSRRESVETVQEDGSTRKTNVFRHLGFVEGEALPEEHSWD